MQGLKSLTGLGYPVLLAASRKSTIGSVLGGIPAEERLEGTIAASCQAVYAGAQMVRVHDVQENLRAIKDAGGNFVMSIAYIALGSNLGDKEANLRQASKMLLVKGLQIRSVSSFFKTEPYGVTDQPEFINAVACVKTDMQHQKSC